MYLLQHSRVSVSSPEKCVDHGGDLPPACLRCDVAVADGGDDGDAVQQGPGDTPLRGLLGHCVRARLPPVITFVLHLQSKAMFIVYRVKYCM